MYTLTFEKTALLEKSAFQHPLNVYELGLCSIVHHVEYTLIRRYSNLLADSISIETNSFVQCTCPTTVALIRRPGRDRKRLGLGWAGL
jgi:hypothetical protein